jgi:hypothetical protein
MLQKDISKNTITQTSLTPYVLFFIDRLFRHHAPKRHFFADPKKCEAQLSKKYQKGFNFGNAL